MSAEDVNRQRCEENDYVQERRRLEREERVVAGTEPSLGTKGKTIVEALVTGVLVGEFIKSFRN